MKNRVVIYFEAFNKGCVHTIIKSEEDGRFVCGDSANYPKEPEVLCGVDVCPYVLEVLPE